MVGYGKDVGSVIHSVVRVILSGESRCMKFSIWDSEVPCEGQTRAGYCRQRGDTNKKIDEPRNGVS